MKPLSLKKKITQLEAFFFAAFLFLLVLSRIIRYDDSGSPLIGAALLAFSAFQVSKLVRFYRVANTVINTLWLITIGLVLAGGMFTFFEVQWGVMGLIGIVMFHYTWRHAFLDNRREIV